MEHSTKSMRIQTNLRLDIIKIIEWAQYFQGLLTET